MKKSVFLVFLLAFSLMLTGCTKADKTFTGAGVSITLNESFVEKEVVQAPLYLESQDHIFMAIRELKTDLSGYNITTLEGYINAVLSNSGKTAEVFTKEGTEETYMYAYYESTVGDQTFGYMLLVFEGDTHFYSMNFGCLSSKLEKNKDQYFDWAKTITIE
ncbi:MAG: hypothetical protein CVV63_03575 [Tenericutes bacterium HGW-Tenericutes-8]|nr:MAG: hypothetical protein CVV63_03575 [Tenericutes bacterium HGW-Tenericutes-8]